MIRWCVFHWLVLGPLLLIYLALATPVVGNLIYLGQYDQLSAHCPPHAGSPPGPPCYRNGVDVRTLGYNYGLGIFALGLPNPVLAFAAVRAIVPPWLLYPWLLAWPLTALGALRVRSELRRAEA